MVPRQNVNINEITPMVQIVTERGPVRKLFVCGFTLRPRLVLAIVNHTNWSRR